MKAGRSAGSSPTAPPMVPSRSSAPPPGPTSALAAAPAGAGGRGSGVGILKRGAAAGAGVLTLPPPPPSLLLLLLLAPVLLNVVPLLQPLLFRAPVRGGKTNDCWPSPIWAPRSTTPLPGPVGAAARQPKGGCGCGRREPPAAAVVAAAHAALAAAPSCGMPPRAVASTWLCPLRKAEGETVMALGAKGGADEVVPQGPIWPACINSIQGSGSRVSCCRVGCSMWPNLAALCMSGGTGLPSPIEALTGCTEFSSHRSSSCSVIALVGHAPGATRPAVGRGGRRPPCCHPCALCARAAGARVR